MILFYLLSLLPIFIGGILWFFGTKIHLIEWIGSSVIAIMVSAIMHYIAMKGMTADEEVWSGQIVMAKQFSRWKEYYEYAVYRTEYYTATETYSDSKGRMHTRTVLRSRRVFDHWEPTLRWHDAYWKAYSNISTDYNISQQDFEQFTKLFADRTTVKGSRTTGEHNSRMIGGDPNDYESNNKTGWIQPVTKRVSFENRIKAAPSVFSFAPIPEKVQVAEYPYCPDPWHSNRLIGVKDIDLLPWDQMNARLGPSKFVNVILIETKEDSQWCEYQKAKFIGGKKNDLILIKGSDYSRVFGWSESETCKRNLETILLENPLDNKIIPLIEKEIRANYIVKDWKKFDYLTIEPRPIHYIILFIVMLLTQIGCYVGFSLNSFQKDDSLN